LTQPPLIGILIVNDERFHKTEKYWVQAYFSYVPRSYIDIVEQTGSIPILIPFDLPRDRLDYLLDHVQAIISLR
jgi:gamma-glutamyl-gamma-aminobutyrate hydrolase PuuD